MRYDYCSCNNEDKRLLKEKDEWIKELNSYCKKLERLLLDIGNSCLCDRNVKGFDYHEIHPKLGKTVGRWNTPNQLLDDRIGFEWRYEKPDGCANSWKYYKFKFVEQREGFK